MHNLPLNVGLHHLNYYFDEEILNKVEVDQRLSVIPCTAGTCMQIASSYIPMHIIILIHLLLLCMCHTTLIIKSHM